MMEGDLSYFDVKLLSDDDFELVLELTPYTSGIMQLALFADLYWTAFNGSDVTMNGYRQLKIDALCGELGMNPRDPLEICLAVLKGMN
jgi:hypothetical protein